MKAIDRLYIYLESQGIKPTIFEREVGFSSGYLSNMRKRKADLGESSLNKVIENCHLLSLEWLLTGNGDMLKQNIVKTGKKLSLVPVPDLNTIPIINIETAAGIGTYNNDHIETLDELTIPANLLQRNGARYFAIRTKGHSMSPTIFDKDYLIIRYLERAEWQNLRDEYVYVIVDKEGKSYVKRIKDRLQKGFIVCMSDNLDKGNYPNFTLDENEIVNLFYVELKMSPYLPNINSTYYERLKELEDKMDDFEAWRRKLKK